MLVNARSKSFSKATIAAAVAVLGLSVAAIAAPQEKQGPPPRGPDGGRPVEKIAEELGVTPEAFREAFQKVRPARPGEEPTQEQRQANRAALSEALGVSPERLDEVMDKYRPGGRGTNGPNGQQTQDNGASQGGPEDGQPGPPPRDQRRGPPVEQMAKALDLPEEKVREAFAKVPKPTPGEPPSEEQRAECRRILAEELGVSEEQIDAAMRKSRPAPGGQGPGGQGQGGQGSGGQGQNDQRRPPRDDQQGPPQDGQRRPARQGPQR